MHRYNQRGWRGSGLEGQTLPLHPCGQLTRCFSAVAELLVVIVDISSRLKLEGSYSLLSRKLVTVTHK